MIVLSSVPVLVHAQGAVKTELKNDGGNWTLVRDGQPYFIQGAGGDASKQFLKDEGGNSFRTWGADNIDAKLDALGLHLVGILEHEAIVVAAIHTL